MMLTVVQTILLLIMGGFFMKAFKQMSSSADALTAAVASLQAVALTVAPALAAAKASGATPPGDPAAAQAVADATKAISDAVKVISDAVSPPAPTAPATHPATV